MYRDVSACNTYNYGDALYWDARYIQEGGSLYDWYQRYAALRPFVRKYIPTSSRVLMVGCGNAGTLDSLMCGVDAPISAAQMLGEVCRLLKPGGIYLLITYGDPKVRIPHLSKPVYNWNIELYIIPRPGFQRPAGSTITRSYLEPIPTTEEGLLPADFVLEDPESHYIYVCRKMD